MLVFFLQHMAVFSDRINQVSIIQSGWLTAEIAQPGKTLASVLLEQLKGSTLVYIASSATSGFYNSPQPYLTILASLLFLIGMAYTFQQLPRVSSMILLTWFWLVVLVGGVLTIGPPANTRLIMTIPAVAVFVAIGITKMVEVLGLLRLPAAWQSVTSALLVIFLVVQNAVFYFGAYRAGNYFDDANSEVAMQAGSTLRELGPEFTLCMLAQPRMFSDFPTIVFLAPKNPRIDIDPTQVAGVDLSADLPAFVIATPDNLPALQVLAERFPGGTWKDVPSKTRKETLYYSYVISTAARP
jgi:hypothetical protein